MNDHSFSRMTALIARLNNPLCLCASLCLGTDRSFRAKHAKDRKVAKEISFSDDAQVRGGFYRQGKRWKSVPFGVPASLARIQCSEYTEVTRLLKRHRMAASVQ